MQRRTFNRGGRCPLVEVARAIRVIASSGTLGSGEIAQVKQWFAASTEWRFTSKNGREERDARTAMAPAGPCK
jgi:hypothetical protein